MTSARCYLSAISQPAQSVGLVACCQHSTLTTPPSSTLHTLHAIAPSRPVLPRLRGRAPRDIWVGSRTVLDGAERISVSPGGALRIGLGGFGLSSEHYASVVRVREGMAT